jgi:hypothetical protein
VAVAGEDAEALAMGAAAVLEAAAAMDARAFRGCELAGWFGLAL